MANDPGLGEGGTPSLPAYSYSSSADSPTIGSSYLSRQASRDARTAYQQQAAVADASGTNLITNDATGFGLNRPYLPWNVYPTANEAAPPQTTTSGSFGSLLTCSNEPQHPKIRVRVRVVNGAGTSSEVRLTDRVTGTVLSSVLVVGSGSTVESDLEGSLVAPSLAGAGAPMRVDVQARRTGGANSVAVLVLHALGKGS
jgi:hypothetical protein